MWSEEGVLLAKKRLENTWRRSFELQRAGPSLLFRSGDLAARLSHTKHASTDDVAYELRVANSITHLLLGDERRKAEGRRRIEDIRKGSEPFSWQDA